MFSNTVGIKITLSSQVKILYWKEESTDLDELPPPWEQAVETRKDIAKEIGEKKRRRSLTE
jgi:hypothetical protein